MAGKATITATKAGGANYKDVSASYILTVNKADQPNFKFAQNSITITYEPAASTTNLAIGSSGTGTTRYFIVGGGSSVATVDTDSGEVTIQGAGTVQIEATNAGDTNYNPKTAKYVLEVEKAEQASFRFAQNSITITYEPRCKHN